MLKDSEAILKSLEGKTVLKAGYFNKEEMAQIGWDDYNDPGIYFILTGNHQLIVQKDPEGNGPGRLLYTDPQNKATIL